MKIRNHRNKEWWFYPHDDSKLYIGKAYRFKYKSSLIIFLNANFEEALNGEVRLEESCFGHSGCLRMWYVWYNSNTYKISRKLKIELKQLNFRGRKYVHKPFKVSKSDKKYFAFSHKVISLMCRIKDDNGTILPNDAKKLVELYKKRGFKDFVPDDDDLTYINGHISDGIDFFHWSDRCNWLRTKTVIEYFKIKGLLN